MEKGRVSVVIPVYNGEDFIEFAINSALNQSYKNVEVVVVNDCSTDRTEEIVFRKFSNLIGKKIIYHKNEKNMERAYSRNIGVERSSGEYIFFLDADDEWEVDYIKRVVDIFNLENIDIVYSFPRVFINEVGKLVRISKKKIPDDLGEIIFSAIIGYPTATAIKKEEFLNYNGKYIPREDWEFYIRAYLKGLKIKVDDNRMVKMREHSKRTSAAKCFFYSTIRVYEDYRERIPDKYLPYIYYHLSEVSLRFGELKTGLSFLGKLLSKKPSILFQRHRLFSLLKRLARIDRFLGYNIKECRNQPEEHYAKDLYI